jgi:hypothetical protein
MSLDILSMTHVWNETNTKLLGFIIITSKKVTKNNFLLNIKINSPCNDNGSTITPEKCYENALLSKNTIFIENKGQSGVYR